MAFNSASDAFVDCTALVSDERMGDGSGDHDEGCVGELSRGKPEAERGDELG